MRRAPRALLVVLACTGCDLALGFDDLAFDRRGGGGTAGSASDGGGGSASDGGGGVASVGGMGGIGGAGGASGGGGSQPTAAGLELVGSIGAGSFSLRVEDLFQIDFRESDSWQIGSWFDLSSNPNQDLASQIPTTGTTSLLHSAFDVQYQGTWYGGDEAISGSVTLVDQTPARVIVTTNIDWAPASAGLDVMTVYHVYSTGRIGTEVCLTNNSGVSRDLDDVKANYTTLSNSYTWVTNTTSTARGATWRRTDGADPQSNLMLLQLGIEGPPVQDDANNFHFAIGATTLPDGDFIFRGGQLQLGPSGLDDIQLEANTDEVLSTPVVEEVMGGVFASYDINQAAVIVNATTTNVSIRMSNTRRIAQPAFVITNFTPTDWSVTLDGEPLVTSAEPLGQKAHAFYDTASQSLVISSLETTPTPGTEAERTYVVAGN